MNNSAISNEVYILIVSGLVNVSDEDISDDLKAMISYAETENLVKIIDYSYRSSYSYFDSIAQY